MGPLPGAGEKLQLASRVLSMRTTVMVETFEKGENREQNPPFFD
jgi:hypothetical protein